MTTVDTMRLTGNDAEWMEGICCHPSIAPFLRDDLSGDMTIEKAKVLLGCPEIVVLAPERKGLFLFLPLNSILYDVHSMILPQFRAGHCLRLAGMAVGWLFENTGCRKIVSWVPVYNRAAYALALRFGFRLEGTITESFLHEGKLIDQWIVGLTKEKFLCH